MLISAKPELLNPAINGSLRPYELDRYTEGIHRQPSEN